MTTDQAALAYLVAAMSERHGSYGFLCETGGVPFLAHQAVGNVVFRFLPGLQQ